MKRTSKFIFGALAIGLMACSNDIPGVDDNNVDATGQTAYMRVNISSAPDATRATEDEGFVYGTADEHAVHDAQFFFFDENGKFVTKATVWTGGNENSNSNEGRDQNVEYFGNNVIVLKNLTQTPVRYMLTVLNLPDFEPLSTIEATATSLYNWQNTIDGNNYHVMTTATYLDEGNDRHHNNKYPYATYIQNGDYQVQPKDVSFSADDLGTDVVDIYVERLAAKVEVRVSDSFTSDDQLAIVTLNDGTKLFPIRATVSGYNNGTLEGDQTDDTGAEVVYVRFTGWGLNAVLPKSALFKQIDSDWINNPPFTGWNDATHFRSYWTKTPYYGNDPTEYLSYFTFDELQSKLGYKGEGNVRYESDINYCNGNTNTLEAIYQGQNLVPSKVTHAIIGARICDKEGNPLDLIRATSGEMYTKQSYINYVYNLANPLIYYDNEDGQTRSQVSPDDLEFELRRNGGNVIRIFLTKVKDESKTYYDVNGDPIDSPVDRIQGFLTQVQSSLQPEVYTGGAMYYVVPIEHMAAINPGPDDKPYNTLGYYGVVRNFWYAITLNSLSRFGHGVFDPGNEKLIPDAPETDNYLLGAKINILSWKVLHQGVNM